MGNDCMARIEALRQEADTAEQVEGDLERAIRLLDQAAIIAESCPDPLGFGVVWRGRASAYQDYDPKKSLSAYHKAAAIYRAHSTPFEVAKTRTGEIILLGRLERFDDAVRLAEAIRPHFIDFPIGLAYVDNNLGQTLTWAMRDEAALEAYARAYEKFAELGMDLWVARTLNNMGASCLHLDRLDEARTYFEQSYPTIRDANDTVAQLRVERNLARIYYQTGNYQQALAYISLSRKTAETLVDPGKDNADGDFFDARIQRALNQSEEAKRLLHSALAVFEALGHRIESAETLLELAHVLHDTPTPDSLIAALDALDRAAALLDPLDVPLFKAIVQHQQGELRLELGRLPEAARHAATARDAFAAHGLDLRQADVLALLADCRQTSDPDSAETHYRTALDLAGDAAPLTAVRCRRGLGRIAAARGAYAVAETHYTHALDTLDAMRTALTLHRHQAGFLADKQQLGEELLAALHAQEQSADRVLTWVERLKARALVDLLGRQPPDTDTIDAELRALLAEREKIAGALDQQVTAFSQRSAQRIAVSASRSSAVAQHDARTQSELADLNRRLRKLDATIAGRRDQADAWRNTQHATVVDVHALLDARTALISYYVSNGTLYALTATNDPDSLATTALTVRAADVTRIWRQSRRRVIRPNSRLRDVQTRLSHLYDGLLAPLESRIAGRERLIIIPHGSLFQIPFSGLYDAVRETYAVDRWCIQVAPSIAVWQHCRNTPAADTPPLLLGYPGEPGQADYLPAVNAEIDAVHALLPRADTLRNSDATRAALLAEMPGRAIVHLAGHIVYDGDDALASGMPLADGRRLRASDLYLHFGRLRGATVVLSGCDSARVEALGGDVLGLTSAFLYAGAAGLIAGLWKVDDAATAQLMTGFYEQALTGLDSAAALRRAQLALRHSDAYAAPAYWAPFTLNGDSRPLS